MSATATVPQKSTREQAADKASELLEQVLASTPTASGSVIVTAFEGEHISRIRDLLPETLKPEAARFVKRAVLYFQRKPELMNCTMESKIRCILDAAEMGLALDGNLCYAVPYKNKHKDANGREVWKDEVQCQPSYKGLTVVARRTGQIVDIYGDVVCEGDQFKHGRNGPNSYLEHSYDHELPRGKVKACYMVVKLPGGDWRYELMLLADLERIRSLSKMANGPAWTKHPAEMQKKTCLRRALKLYCDDPGVMHAIELDEREYGEDNGDWINPGEARSRVAKSGLNDVLRPQSPPAKSAPPADEELPVFDDNGNAAGAPTGEESQEPPAASNFETDGSLSDFGREIHDKACDPKATVGTLTTLMQELRARRGELSGDEEFAFIDGKIQQVVKGKKGK